MTDQRKKSPRAPSMPLEESFKRAHAIYEKEGLHSVSTDVAALDMGYKDASSGASKQAIGALKAFGLLLSQKSGHVSVSESVQKYIYSPDSNIKKEIIREWVVRPRVYSSLLEKYKDHLPSTAQLKFELIDMGFSPKAADECVENFIQSVEYANFYSDDSFMKSDEQLGEDVSSIPESVNSDDRTKKSNINIELETNIDRIPIRLPGGRKAWLEIPTPFYEKDKLVIKDQVDLIVTDEEMHD